MLGVIFSGEAEKIYKRKDAQMIVIDEACGMMLSLFLVPYNVWIMILGFILFRIFDIIALEGESNHFPIINALSKLGRSDTQA